MRYDSPLYIIEETSFHLGETSLHLEEASVVTTGGSGPGVDFVSWSPGIHHIMTLSMTLQRPGLLLSESLRP